MTHALNSPDMHPRETTRQFLERRWWGMYQLRLSWDTHWQELSEYILPRTGRFLTGQYLESLAGESSGTTGGFASSGTLTSQAISWGGRKNDKIIDGTGTFALRNLTSGLMSGVTSPARRWFRLVPQDRKLFDDHRITQWIDMIEELTFDIYKASNLYQVLPPVYEELGCYGTGAVGMFPDWENVVRFEKYTCGEYWIDQDYRWKVDTFFRLLYMTTEQIVRKYAVLNGEIHQDKWRMLSREVRNSWNSMRYGEYWPVMECILPAENRKFTDGGELQFEDFDFIHIVYERGSPDTRDRRDEAGVLHTGGFRHFPIMVPRWHLLNPDVYGRSPGMDSLGDVKQLQKSQEIKADALAKMADPPLLAASALKNERVSSLPGDITFNKTIGVDSRERGLEPVYEVNPRLAEFTQDQIMNQRRIEKHMYSDLFTGFSEETRSNITATEIQARMDEKLLALGPTLLRLDEDLLKPLIDRTFMRLEEADLLGDVPDELQGSNLQVEYLSVIAQAQRVQALAGLQEAQMMVYEVAQVQAGLGETRLVSDVWDADAALKKIAENRGLPPDVVRPDDEVERIRQDRQEAIEAQQAAAAAEQAVDAGQKLGGVQTGEGPGENLATDALEMALQQGQVEEQGYGA